MTAALAPLDPHHVLDRLKSGDNIKLLRQSNIGSADICLRRAGYDMQPNAPRRSGEARCVGTAYHAGLEFYYRSRMRTDGGEDPFPPTLVECQDSAYTAFQAEAALFDHWVTSAEASWERTKDLLAKYFEFHCPWPMDHEILGVEQEWFLPLSRDWFIKGSIDLVVRKPDGGLILGDHKTAGRKWDKKKHLPEKQNQACIYTWAWWSLTGEMPEAFTFDIMTYKGEFDRRYCNVEPRHIQAVMHKAVSMAYLFDQVPLDLLPTNTSQTLCSSQYCDWWAACPSGLALAPVVVADPASVVADGAAHSDESALTIEETA